MATSQALYFSDVQIKLCLNFQSIFRIFWKNLFLERRFSLDLVLLFLIFTHLFVKGKVRIFNSRLVFDALMAVIYDFILKKAVTVGIN